MTIRLNGKDHETAAPTIATLLEELALPRQTTLVEQNGEARPRDEWQSATLQDGDKLEILRVAAGG